MRKSPEELERLLNAGAWLRPGDVARIFSTERLPDQAQVTRWTVVGWIKAKKIRVRRTPGGHRECKPDDVRRLLAEYRTEER